MGDLRSVAWLVLVIGCSADAPSAPAPPPGGDCLPRSMGSSALRLHAITPDVVPLHGGDVALTFDGSMPIDQAIYVNDVEATLDGTTLHVPAVPAIGPLSIRVGDEPLASLECAGHYAAAADSVALAETTARLAVPLHPELAHDCARHALVDITNSGDDAFVIYPELTGSPSFEPYFPPDQCPLPMFYDSC